MLAAGAGRRFGGPKAPVEVDGERLVDRAVRVLREGGCEPILVVLGAWVGEVPGAQVVVNSHWEQGMGTSLREGLQAIAAHEPATRVVVTLVDLPGLTGDAVRRLVAMEADLAAAAYSGERGHPVLMARSHWEPLSAIVDGDAGARDYLAAHDVALVEVGDVATGDDMDIAP